MRKMLAGVAVPAVAAGLIAAGCTNSEQPAPQPSTTAAGSHPGATHERADVRFVAAMIPHHEQAVRMADLVPERTGNAALRKLAGQIKAAQQPEIDQMHGWLRQWHAGSANRSPHMSGMTSHGGMAELETAHGAAFDRMWLQMMIEHHRGAVDMANTELRQGSSTAAKRLARDIVGTQRAEIARMRGMLD